MWKFNEDVEVANVEPPNIFGFWRYFLKLSPFNCSKGPLQIPCAIFSVVIILAMGMRIVWLFWVARTSFLSYGWGERNIYVFLTIESISFLIAVVRMTSFGSIHRFELDMGALRTLRMKKRYDEFDNYALLNIPLIVILSFIGASIIGSAVYLLVNEKVVYGTTHQSSWYYILNFIVNIFCFYLQLLYLPIHVLINFAIRREVDIFNLELEEALKKPKFETLKRFENRQITILNFSNDMNIKIGRLLNFSGFFTMMGVCSGAYIVASLRKETDTLYFIFNIGLTVSAFITFIILLIPQALVQEKLKKTGWMLFSSFSLQQTSEIFQTCRIMIDRSLHNRRACTVLFMFDVTRKNIKRALFVIIHVVVIMIIVYDFKEIPEDIGSHLKGLTGLLGLKTPSLAGHNVTEG